MKGLFVTFEGPDGGGKTTQLRMLHEVLLEKGLPVVVTREPGGTVISDHIRELLLNPDFGEMHAKTEVLLYASSRAQHVHEKILPALAEGKIVLCDRFTDASLAYQGHGLGMGEADIRWINQFATGGLAPTRTYLLDIPVAQALERLQMRKQVEFEQELDRIEQRELVFHQTVRNAFHQLARQEQRIVLIDGNQTVQQIHQQVVQDFNEVLLAKRKQT